MNRVENNYNFKDLELIQKFFRSKDYLQALRKLEKIISKFRYSDDLLNFKSIILLEINSFDDAFKTLEIALELNPKNYITYCNIGNVNLKKKHFEQAIKYYLHALELNPSDLNSLLNLANSYFLTSEFLKSIEVLNNVLNIDCNIESAHQLLSSNYKELHMYLKYENELRLSQKINPSNYENYFHLGFCSQTKNDLDAAINFYNLAIKYKPTHGQSYYNIVQIKKTTVNDHLFNEIDLITSKQKKMSPEDLSFFFLALSEVYFNSGNFNKSVIFLNKANKIRSKIYPYTHSEEIDFFNKCHALYSLLSNDINIYTFTDRDFDITPIFIFGLPRTGSSLIEQILSNFDNVYGGGEINVLYDMLSELVRTNSSKLNIQHNLLNTIRLKYLNHLKSITNKSFITDKLPLNFKFIGLIKILFPNAIFIHTTRNSFSTFLSMYRQFFSGDSLKFSYKKSDIINFYNIYIEYMNLWKSMNISFFDFNYDQFINDKNKIFSELCNFIGFNADTKYLDISKNKRPVMTASNLQIREQINSSKFLPDQLVNEFPEFIF